MTFKIALNKIFVNEREKKNSKAGEIKIALDQPTVILDCRYLSMHTRPDVLISLRLQMMRIFTEQLLGKPMPHFSSNNPINRLLQALFCNYDQGSVFHNEYGNSLLWEKYGVFKTKKSYLEIFPKEKLVYLSPDASTPMNDYDPSKVYIIGTIVDYSFTKFQKSTFNQAQEDGIACECLPIESQLK
jgi:Trm5-related predicted tRNA methylase